ncbi:MAG: bifunctional riboflavin kinase/FAD synthetase [Chloroflexi bacterium]|nr:bifunctional riboflavin kinase/FAD synthetase [Chloroflexota bacterium]
MQAYQELSRVRPAGPAVATIGVFDGVHLGHQHLLKRLREEARRQGCPSVVVTFRNHPRMVLRPETKLSYLMAPEDRLRLLKAQGVDVVAPITFDLDLSRLSARAFVALLKETLLLQALVTGPDFALGHQREGTTPVLEALGRELGFSVHQVSPLVVQGLTVSSTAIRQALAQGDVAKVSFMLGRDYALEGVVGRGEGRGRRLGFPTANLQVEPSRALPADGIYATWACVNGVAHKSATSIGVRPTFGAGERTVETYILDFHEDIYGHPMRLAFASRLRDELRFDTAEALVAQMHQDIAQARVALAARPTATPSPEPE